MFKAILLVICAILLLFSPHRLQLLLVGFCIYIGKLLLFKENSDENPMKKKRYDFDDLKQPTDMLGVHAYSQDMREILRSELFSDITIKVSNENFRAHKVILAARSPVLSTLIQNVMIESQSTIYTSNCMPNAFREFLEYLYTGITEGLTVDNVFDVYKLADKYDVQQLKSDCAVILTKNLSVDSFCDIMSLARKYDEPELIKSATDFFLRNTKSILLTIQWQTFIEENPQIANELFLKAANDTGKRRSLF